MGWLSVTQPEGQAGHTCYVRSVGLSFSGWGVFVWVWSPRYRNHRQKDSSPKSENIRLGIAWVSGDIIFVTSDNKHMNQTNKNVTLPPDQAAETNKREGSVGFFFRGAHFYNLHVSARAERWPLPISRRDNGLKKKKKDGWRNNGREKSYLIK